MRKHKKLLALLFCAFLLCAFLSFYAFMGAVSDHECTHVHCEICEQAALIKSLLRVVLVLAALSAVFGNPFAGIPRISLPAAKTPVACKVRLNN